MNNTAKVDVAATVKAAGLEAIRANSGFDSHRDHKIYNNEYTYKNRNVKRTVQKVQP